MRLFIISIILLITSTLCMAERPEGAWEQGLYGLYLDDDYNHACRRVEEIKEAYNHYKTTPLDSYVRVLGNECRLETDLPNGPFLLISIRGGEDTKVERMYISSRIFVLIYAKDAVVCAETLASTMVYSSGWAGEGESSERGYLWKRPLWEMLVDLGGNYLLQKSGRGEISSFN